MEVRQHPIQVVARRTAVPATTLRMWEQRYQAIHPNRDTSGRRLYRETDVVRIEMLSALVDAGYRISDIADRDDQALAGLIDTIEQGLLPTGRSQRFSADDPEASVEHLLETAIRGDLHRIEATLEELSAIHGPLDVIDTLVFRAMRTAHDRLASGHMSRSGVSLLHAALIRFVTRLAVGPLRPTGDSVSTVRNAAAPVVAVGVLGTQTDQLGALSALVHVHAAGWYPLWLGGGIASRSVVGAMEISGASAALMTAAVYADEDTSSRSAEIRDALIQIGGMVPAGRPVLFGGRVPDWVTQGLPEHGVRPVPSMSALRHELGAIRGAGRQVAAE